MNEDRKEFEAWVNVNRPSFWSKSICPISTRHRKAHASIGSANDLHKITARVRLYFWKVYKHAAPFVRVARLLAID